MIKINPNGSQNMLIFILAALLFFAFTPAQAAETPSGIWEITEAQTPKNVAYTGDVEFRNIGQCFTMTWKTTLGTITGYGFYEDNHLFLGTGHGDTFGTQLFKIKEDGKLESKYTFLGALGIGSERTLNGTPGKFDGKYNMKGVNVRSDYFYTGEITMKKKGDVYDVKWYVDDKIYNGIGLRSGDWLIVGFGRTVPKGFGVSYYKFDGDTAEGRMSFYGKSTIIKEKVVRVKSKPTEETPKKDSDKEKNKEKR